MQIPPTNRQRLGGAVHLLTDIEARPSERAVLRTLKIPRAVTIDALDDPVLGADLRQALERAEQLVQCRAVVRWFSLGGGVLPRHPIVEQLLAGHDVVRWLDGCTRASFVVVTIGERLPRRVDELQHSSLTEAMCLDAVGSAWVEAVVDAVGLDVGRAVRLAGCEPTLRRSPGYGDWPLQVQPAVLRACHAERIGVTSDRSHLLLPVKSVTAVIGWSPAQDSSAS